MRLYDAVSDTGVLIDSDNNQSDFSELAVTSPVGGGLGPFDECVNMAGLQLIVPEGFVQDEQGMCAEVPIITDYCINIVGDQATIPDGYQVDDNQNCTLIPAEETDACPNIDGIQESVPDSAVHLNVDGKQNA